MSEPHEIAYAPNETRKSGDDSRREDGTMSHVSSNLLILPGRTCARYATLPFSLFLSSRSPAAHGDALSFPFSRATPIARCAVHCYSDGASSRPRMARLYNRTLRGKERRMYARILYDTGGDLQSHALDARDSGVRCSGMSRHSRP